MKPRDNLTAFIGARLLAEMIAIGVRQHGRYALGDHFDEFLEHLPAFLRFHGLTMTRENNRWVVTKETT